MMNNVELVTKYNELVLEEAFEANKSYSDPNGMAYAYAFGTMMGSLFNFAHLPGFEQAMLRLIDNVEKRRANPSPQN
jgi:hypothetical protein